MHMLSGHICNAELCEPLDSCRLHLFSNDELILETITKKDGAFKIEWVSKATHLAISKKGYITKHYYSIDVPAISRLLKDKIIGYQEKLWFKPGALISTKVHSSRPFQAKLFRHGIEKKEILNLGNQNAIVQEVPDGFFVLDGLAWKESFQYKIPDEAKPGIYSLLLKDSIGEIFAIPMLISSAQIKPDSPKILVLASTNNWQCYNLWGGRSRYRNFEHTHTSLSKLKSNIDLKLKLIQLAGLILPVKLKIWILNKIKKAEVPKPWMLHKISIKRPHTNCALEGNSPMDPFTNHLASGEWRVNAWLEKNGYDYDVVSGNELDQNPDILVNYAGIILSTHCEYWTKKMFDALDKFHNNKGLWILNISGNSIFREVLFEKDGSIKCVSLYFKDSCADETALIGVRFSSLDYGTCAPFKFVTKNHWTLYGLNDRDQNSTFGSHSLNKKTPLISPFFDPGRPGNPNGLRGEGASGWETDKLSATAPKDIIKIAKGMNAKGGADMIIREPKGKRGGLFSVSSVTFGGALLIDNVCSQITANVLNRVLKKKVKL